MFTLSLSCPSLVNHNPNLEGVQKFNRKLGDGNHQLDGLGQDSKFVCVSAGCPSFPCGSLCLFIPHTCLPSFSVSVSVSVCALVEFVQIESSLRVVSAGLLCDILLQEYFIFCKEVFLSFLEDVLGQHASLGGGRFFNLDAVRTHTFSFGGK